MSEANLGSYRANRGSVPADLIFCDLGARLIQRFQIRSA